MEWIKRNLLFVLGSVVSVVLMVLAALYLMKGMGQNDQALTRLNEEYGKLNQLNSQNPHPGDEQTDNIAAAKRQKKEVDEVIQRAAEVFKPIPAIPPGTNVTSAAFAGALRRTIDRLQQEAARGGVQLTTNFFFSFTAVQNRIMFDQAGLHPLATQLGEVKAICDILMEARVNALDAVRRPKVSTHDIEAQQTADYITDSAVTNDIAVLAPYEITFRSFSAELAEVLSKFASSSNGLIVRAINVEPVMASLSPYGDATGGYAPGYGANPYEAVAPAYVAPAQPAVAYPTYPAAGGLEGNRYSTGDATAGNRYADNRYGGEAGLGDPYGGNRYGGNQYGGNPYGGAAEGYGGAVAPTYPPTGYPAAGYGYPATRPRTGARGLPTMLDEKQFKVTLLVQVVRLNLTSTE